MREVDSEGDAAALRGFAERWAKGEEATIPGEVVDRLLAGESPLRVWREFRGISAAALAASLGITPAHVSKLESGKGEPSVPLLRKLCKVLDVSMEDLAGIEPD